ncbi:MAG: hypothetical protein H2184_15870 [Candidatus Galacturonibacter soehngenii]|nr:hypothetical protein [Candidatus Galacturonibacter soehngenii]
MQVVYFASPAYNEVIRKTIESCERIILSDSDSANDYDFYKYVKSHISFIGTVNEIVLDINSTNNLDNEIIEAIGMLRSMYNDLKIIIIATNRYVGDDLLATLFGMGIQNIICTNDYVDIQTELKICLERGKTYNESCKFKDVKKEKVVVRNEIKQTVEKVMIGFAGATENIGVTHNAIIMANWLRKKGFMVAFVEFQKKYLELKDELSPFESIKESFDEKLIDEKYFTVGGVDYYQKANVDVLSSVLSKSYNFIVIDFGCFRSYDKMEFGRCAERIVVSGSKPWELESMLDFFDDLSGMSMETTHFCFNHTHEDMYKGIKENMDEVESIHFLKYITDPFNSYDFSDAEIIMKKYMPVVIEEKKKGIFNRKKNKQR